MRVVIIGGTGHIGTYLTPRLVRAGHDVVVVSRGQRNPYHMQAEWDSVTRVTIDRAEAESRGEFGPRIRALEPDTVIDLICSQPESTAGLIEALRGQVEQFLHCGTIWVHGRSEVVPTREDHPRRPLEDYGRRKLAIERMLMHEARTGGLPATVLHSGHIVGPGWIPVTPAVNSDPEVFRALATGKEVVLPNLGMETLHHVHADDLAQAFMCAITHWSSAVGESFHAVSEQAVTLRGYAEAVASWFGREAHLRFEAWTQWRESLSESEAAVAESYLQHSPNCSIEKARTLLDYRPRYSSLEAVRQSVEWLIAQGQLTVD